MNILFSVIPTILVFLLTSYKGIDVYKIKKNLIEEIIDIEYLILH